MAISLDIASLSEADGLHPMAVRKLNSNTASVIRALFAINGNDSAPQIDVNAVAEEAAKKAKASIADELLPVGTILAVKDMSCVPKVGEWERCREYDGLLLRGDAHASVEGSDTVTIAQDQLPIALTNVASGSENAITVSPIPVPQQKPLPIVPRSKGLVLVRRVR